MLFSRITKMLSVAWLGMIVVQLRTFGHFFPKVLSFFRKDNNRSTPKWFGLSLVFIWSLKLQNRRKKKINKSDDNTLKSPKTGAFANNWIIYKCRYTLQQEIISYFKQRKYAPKRYASGLLLCADFSAPPYPPKMPAVPKPFPTSPEISVRKNANF